MTNATIAKKKQPIELVKKLDAIVTAITEINPAVATILTLVIALSLLNNFNNSKIKKKKISKPIIPNCPIIDAKNISERKLVSPFSPNPNKK